MPMKCMDQMPRPIATEPAASQTQVARPVEATILPASSRAA